MNQRPLCCEAGLTSWPNETGFPAGYASGFYSASDLRSDYRRGLVSGITFCLFALPMLTSRESDEVDAGRRGDDDVPEGDQVSNY